MLWIGTYGAKGGKGLYPVVLADGDVRAGAPDTHITDASFGAWCRRTRTAYFVEERDPGRVTAWHPSGGHWTSAGTSRSGGTLPCHLAIHPAGEFLAVANYGDGSISLIGLDTRDGAIERLSDLAKLSGRGFDPVRQTSPHIHCAVFDENGQSLYAVDLGLDRVLCYRPMKGKLGEPDIAYEAPQGSGPRQLLLHPNRRNALLLCELSAEILLLERDGDKLVLLERVGTAPEGAVPGNLGGHLELARDGALVTNRGHDSLVAFALEGDRMKMLGWRSTGGRSPRHFHLARSAAIVAHEESGDVAALALRSFHDGQTTECALLPVPGAAFVIDIPD